MKNKILFLATDGYQPTIIESQLIELKKNIEKRNDNHCRVLFFVFSKSEKAIALNKYNDVIVLLGIKKALPFARFINSIILAINLFKNKIYPDIIHCRTESSLSISLFVKFFCNSKLIWDCRGLSYEEYIFIIKPNRIIKLYKYLQYKIDIIFAKLFCDKAIFVSKDLRDYYSFNHTNKPSYIIPCLSNNELFFYSESLRDKMRNELGFTEKNKVIITIGSNSKWQNINETVDFFIDLFEENPNYKLLLLTNGKIKNHPNIISKFVNYSEVNNYLNAADFAFFTRDDLVLNNVASPVKFSEFSMSGLTVIQNGNVNQVEEFGSIIGNIISLNFIKSKIKKPNNSRDVVMSKSMEFYSMSSYKDVYDSIYKTYKD